MSIEITSLPNSYVLELAKQFAFLGAFLGGFAVTFFATLLSLESSKRILNWVIVFAVIAACSFMVSVIGSVTISFVLHPDAPSVAASDDNSYTVLRLTSILGFVIGIFGLLISIGLGGWIRSRAFGIATSVISSVTLLLILWII